ncbi:hypothetical protein [Photobacterium sp. J15]|uniref:hypothetical protein n=1 Tax=Photobacterium sp. J15 TaxID=265901 RepID=UPI0007E4698C|nr:hypothetical protein [Photobacterium sp. J15]
MLPEVFKRQQKQRFRFFLWFSAVLFIAGVMLVQWQKIEKKAEQTQLRQLEQTFFKSASSFRQEWELQDKPKQLNVDGIQLGFTALGWPIVLHNGQVDCESMWELLASRERSVHYIRFYTEKGMRSEQYNSCFYQITGSNWMELFFKHERIRLNGFLTD